MKPNWVIGFCLGGVACAAPQNAPEPVHAPASALPAPARHTNPSSAPSATAPAITAAAPVAPLKVKLTRLLSVPVTAIALGEGTRVAVLADVPYVGDARGLRPLPLPAMLRPQPSEVDDWGIFFGRDNEPRIMGARRSANGERAVYLRHLASGWRDGREEIGQLGGPAAGGLWGVLGAADPELVCRAGATCIIKRTSGWTTAPAGPVKRIITLQDGLLWGLAADGISSIDAKGWKLAIAAPAWTEPRAFWATPGEAWVSTPSALFHYRANQWATVPSPVGVGTSFWGTRADSIWLVGTTGAAHFDGQRFQPVASEGPLAVVRGRSDAEVWFGGDAGLFRAEPLPPAAE